jgi:hypothetical protein
MGRGQEGRLGRLYCLDGLYRQTAQTNLEEFPAQMRMNCTWDPEIVDNGTRGTKRLKSVLVDRPNEGWGQEPAGFRTDLGRSRPGPTN